MKSAVVLRGFSFHLEYTSRGSCQKTYPIDFRLLYDNYKKNLFSSFPNHDLYLVTYDSPASFKRDLFNLFQDVPTEYYWFEKGSQVDTFHRALRCIRDGYDENVITRFDLVWKKPLSAFRYNKEVLNCPFREYENLWREHHRIGDAIHVFPGELLTNVKEAMIGYNPGTDSLHHLWEHMAGKLGESNMGFLFDGFYDTNPENGGANPLYYIWRGGFRNDL